jgi:signal transduction histidine kinase
MICVALLLASHFLLVKYVVTQLHSIQANTMLVVGLSVIGGLVSALFAIHSNFYHIILFASVWAPFCIIVLFFILKTDAPPTVRELIIYIALYSILSVFLIENLYERKERNQRMFFASRLVTERDFVAEFMFNDIAQRISGDPFIRNFFNSPISPRREVTARLSSLYLSGYFNKYELKVYAFDKHDLPIKNHDTLSLSYFNDKVKSDSFKYNTLYYINDTVQSYSYYSFIRFTDDSAYAGTLVLHLIPKVYYGQNVYPELLLGENVTLLEGESKYNYAIYKRDKLIIQHGDFPYTYYWSKDYNFEGKQYVFIDAGDWEHIIYRFSNDMKVIVTEKHEGLFEPVATFSYLFSFYFLAAVCMLLFARLFLGKTPLTQVLEGFTISFRTRINYSMLLMIVISFIIIGFITISFFSRQYDNFYSDRLLRKEKVLHASLEYFIQQNITGDENLLSDRLSNALNFEVARLSEINDIDINLYDKQGNLEVASQPGIYDKGLVSKKMNPDAYFELVNSKGAQVTEQENVGGLKYLATYAPIRDSKGDAIAYLGIPYFERSKNINDEVSSFLVALMNVYVFLLICAAILAYFISNSITRPLTIISEKLRILNLNKKNEPIEWKSKDEIGVLIGEYNKMINELEQSAYKLARSERESAWREMAKQIAHEIKNPLTPMKLSIQYLQRAIDDGHPNINELAKKVTRTLEEQIENLSSIATAFSSFAKMPKPQNEIIDMNSLLKSIADLFNREEKATITFTTDSAEPLVFADKNQLVSVFNNLVKNAIQSIPENRTGFIDIHIKEDGEWIMASVHDNGSGIPKDLYEKVFVPNFTTKSSGTGLGLAISKQIIEGAGGQIWFESAENVGTSFFVKLKKGSAV